MKRVLLLCMIALTVLSCSKDDDVQLREPSNQEHTLVFETGELQNFVSVFTDTEIVYSDTSEFFVTGYNSDTRTVVIDIPAGAIRVETDFYIEDGSPVTIRLFNSLGNIVDERTIQQQSYTYTYEF